MSGGDEAATGDSICFRAAGEDWPLGLESYNPWKVGNYGHANSRTG
jgi:hypothetical protein